jgi:hypothetical protein
MAGFFGKILATLSVIALPAAAPAPCFDHMARIAEARSQINSFPGILLSYSLSCKEHIARACINEAI